MIQLPLSPEEFAATATRLRERHQIEISGTGGTIEKFGVKGDYVYANGILSITILEKPFFLSAEQCEHQLRSWLGSPG
jgi:hypothetical protein